MNDNAFEMAAAAIRFGVGVTREVGSVRVEPTDESFLEAIAFAHGQAVDGLVTGEKLVNQRFAYVSVSRGQYDAWIYTDDKAKLARALSRDVPRRPPP